MGCLKERKEKEEVDRTENEKNVEKNSKEGKRYGSSTDHASAPH